MAALPANGSGFANAARPAPVDRWAHLLDNDAYMQTAADRLRLWGIESVEDKLMDEGGNLVWVVKWDGGIVTKNDDSAMDNADDAIEAFESTHAPSLDKQTVFPDVVRQSPYAAACNTYHELIAAVWETEQDSTVFDGLEYEDARATILLAFASMDRRLLKEMVMGNLQRRRYLDRDFRLMTDRLRDTQATDSNGKRPSIYDFSFTDEFGRQPTKARANEFLDHLRQYHQDQQFAYDTDLAFDASVALDHARYFGPEQYNRATQGSKRRREIVADFIELSQEYLDDWGVHVMLQAWREVGYAHDAEQRLTEHQNWQSSNYLMVLMELVSFKYFGGEWRNRGERVFDCFERNHARIMEVVFTAITGAKISSGHGMSHHPAGISVASTYYQRDVATWEHWQAIALQMVKYNLEIETADLKKNDADLKTLRMDIEAGEWIARKEKLAAEIALLEEEYEISTIHDAVWTDFPAQRGKYIGAEIEDSDED